MDFSMTFSCIYAVILCSYTCPYLPFPALLVPFHILKNLLCGYGGHTFKPSSEEAEAGLGRHQSL